VRLFDTSPLLARKGYQHRLDSIAAVTATLSGSFHRSQLSYGPPPLGFRPGIRERRAASPGNGLFSIFKGSRVKAPFSTEVASEPQGLNRNDGADAGLADRREQLLETGGRHQTAEVIGSEFAPDSPLEGTGFEPLVPRREPRLPTGYYYTRARRRRWVTARASQCPRLTG
jgi:hypothetical protein